MQALAGRFANAQIAGESERPLGAPPVEMPTSIAEKLSLDPYARDGRRNAAYVTILQRHPMLGVDHCTCGSEVTGGTLVLVLDDGKSQKVVGCWRCGRV